VLLAPLALARLVTAPLLQVAVEYGGTVSGSVRTDASNNLSSAANEMLAHWNAVIPVPPWVAGAGLGALWLFSRRRGGTSSGSGGLGNAVIFVLALAILFVLARAAGVV